jgi:hypothetical protein
VSADQFKVTHATDDGLTSDVEDGGPNPGVELGVSSELQPPPQLVLGVNPSLQVIQTLQVHQEVA